MRATRPFDLDWPLSAAALLIATLAVSGLMRAPTLRPVGWVAPSAAAGELSFHDGEVRRRPAGSLVWYAATAGDTLHVGDAVFVAPRSIATVTLSAGGRLEIEENTLVVLEEPPRGPGTEVNRVALARGSMSGAAGNAPLEIASGGAVAALAAGTLADVQRAGGAAEIAVHRGHVSVRTAGSTTRLSDQDRGRIDAQGTVARTAPFPVKLLAPPHHHRQLASASEALRLAWAGGGQAGLQVQVAPDRAFVDVRRSLRADGEAAVELPAGAYFWRVVDEVGAPQSEVRQFTLLEIPAPVAISPTPGLRLERQVRFAWTAVAGASGYELEISPADGGPPVLSSAARPRHLWDAAPEGEYRWRVRAQLGDLWGPWSTGSSFGVSRDPLPDAPELIAPELEVERASPRGP